MPGIYFFFFLATFFVTFFFAFFVLQQQAMVILLSFCPFLGPLVLMKNPRSIPTGGFSMVSKEGYFFFFFATFFATFFFAFFFVAIGFISFLEEMLTFVRIIACMRDDAKNIYRNLMMIS
ncbi:MAG: hypothetical protein GX606_06165 [Elusimicrobia bacterium]|nr:hypothetical protein [Elusimicrobiota bacterium]